MLLTAVAKVDDDDERRHTSNKGGNGETHVDG
jgi:hypothetical protein